MRWSPSSATRLTVCWTASRTSWQTAVRLWAVTLPDGQGDVGTAESEPPYLAGLSQQRDDSLLPVGRQDSLQGIGHRADACRQLQGSVQACRHIMCCHPIRKKPTTEGLFFPSLSALSLLPFLIVHSPGIVWGERKEKVYRSVVVVCVQSSHDKPPESHTFLSPKPKGNGYHHFKAVHIVTYPIALPDVAHGVAFQ